MDINIHNYLRLDLVDMILVLISTGLIVMIAKKYFWTYVKNYIEAREQFVCNQLSEAQGKLESSQTIEKEAKDELISVRRQANSIIEDAKSAAEKEASDIKKQAHHDAQSIKEKAQADIKHQKAKVVEEMKEEMGEIALLAASKIVKRELNQELQKEYVKEFIDEVKDSSWEV